MKQYAILYDSTYCTGCNTCSYRCVQEFREHDVAARGVFKNFVQILDDGMYTRRCMQCSDPQCVGACSSGALTKSEYGAVLFDGDKCKGDAKCVSACAFHGIQLDTVTHKAVKCNMCAHRLVEDKPPVCVDACPTKALQFGEMSQMLALAKEVAKRDGLKIYGAKENGGTHFIVLTRQQPTALGYPAVPTKRAGISTPANVGSLPLVAGVALAGLETLRRRREEVSREQTESKGND